MKCNMAGRLLLCMTISNNCLLLFSIAIFINSIMDETDNKQGK